MAMSKLATLKNVKSHMDSKFAVQKDTRILMTKECYPAGNLLRILSISHGNNILLELCKCNIEY